MAYKRGGYILTTYIHWDDPPSRMGRLALEHTVVMS